MRMIALLFAVVMVMGIVVIDPLNAASEEAAVSAPQESADVIDVGNKICPLTGEMVDGKSFYVYKGRRYGLCCQQCADTFAQNPETFAAIAEKEVSGR